MATHSWPTLRQCDPERGFTEVERRQSHIDKMTENAKDLVPLAVQCLDDDPEVHPTMIDVSERMKKLKDRSPDLNMNPMSLLQQATIKVLPCANLSWIFYSYMHNIATLHSRKLTVL